MLVLALPQHSHRLPGPAGREQAGRPGDSRRERRANPERRGDRRGSPRRNRCHHCAGRLRRRPGDRDAITHSDGPGSASGTLTLSAGSTPVTHYTISVPSSLLGHLTVSPASGSIAAHQSQPVTVTLHGLLSVDTTITVSPGGQTVTVLLGPQLGN